ncbi:DUF4139 domain-containing protein [Ferruginibacter lapsinanis]|uniref:DUF4139 domain-containing protein n=1 Tax=Ferruginibacter lapsinanis TaxID=563172 RepID=UPI001E429955|nr:DUF4139 domain-containing protein [Ferruginibacter lapsinanis]UEG49172.1 DUF4139 domain-containing protein [Ferruginibacter lapsinanis]
MQKILLLALLGIFNIARAQDTAKVEAKLTTATVYYGYGAELTHEAKLNVNPGIKQIVIKQLSTVIDVNSLQISVPENVMLLSQKYSVFYPTTPPVAVNPVVKAFQDSITAINKLIRRNTNLISIEEQTLEKTGNLIEAVINNSGNKTVSSDETLKLVSAYTVKIEKAKTNIFNLKEIETGLNNRIADFQKKINEAANPIVKTDKPYGQLILQVICKASGEIPVSLSYFTNTAGWTPLYDIRVNSKTNELRLVYKASVTQSTGIDWKQTKLTLSTGSPNLATTAPILSAWYLQLFVPQLYNEVVVTGYATAKRDVRNSIQSTYNDDKKLSEYSIRADESIDPSTLQQFTTLKESQLNTNFEIDLPYDIESDGQIHAVNIKEEKINATLKNYAVPKLDKDAYLLAEVSDWQNLDLLPGTANIIMDNTYLGKSFIDPNSTADTLNLSLGKDRRVAIKRSTVKDFTSTKTNGNTTKQTFTYEITVKNNKLTTVDLLLKDQYPISNVKDIEVKLEDNGNAAVNEEVGVLTWKLQLKPGESKKVRFTYTVKYPKDKKVSNL